MLRSLHITMMADGLAWRRKQLVQREDTSHLPHVVHQLSSAYMSRVKDGGASGRRVHLACLMRVILFNEEYQNHPL